MRINKLILIAVFGIIVSLLTGPDIRVNAEENSSKEAANSSIEAPGTMLGFTEVTDISYEEISEAEADIVIGCLSDNSTPELFYRDLYGHLMAREPDFDVVYMGAYADIAKGASAILDRVMEIDDLKTTDDADYLIGSILRFGYSAKYSSSKATFHFTITYVETASQLKKVNKAVKTGLESLPLTGCTDEEKVKLIHDYVINILAYDITYTDHSPYGGLVASKHTTVCQGYALLMYKLMTEAGVDCHYVTGNAPTAHAWNIVNIGGNWYSLDATWDDPIADTPKLVYNYFLVGTDTINQNHTIDAKYSSAYSLCKTDFDWENTASVNSDSDTAGNDGDKSQTDQKETGAGGDEGGTSKEKSSTRLVNAHRSSLYESEKTRKSAMKNMDKDTYSGAVKQLLMEEMEYESFEDYEKAVYDLYLEIFGTVIKKVDSKHLKRLKEEDEVLWSYMFAKADAKIQKYIIKPTVKYLKSDTYSQDMLKLFNKEFTEEEMLELTDENIDELASSYVVKLTTDKVNKLSKKYTAKIVKAVVKAVNKKK